MGAAAVAFLVAIVVLLVVTPGGLPRRLALVAFGLGLVGLFTVSSLYHSVPWRPTVKDFLPPGKGRLYP